MTADFWKPFPFRYAPLQRLPKIIVLYFDFIFYKKWVTSIYNADFTILFPRRSSCSTFFVPRKNRPAKCAERFFYTLLSVEDALDFLTYKSENEEDSLEEAIEEVVR